MPESDYKYQFTVFTPTYNRAYCLGDLYKSLVEQTFKDFEWLIVDDGSTDNTEELVENWIREGSLRIRFIKQANGGKHRAINAGVAQAEGYFFFIVDSDDTLLPDALSVFFQEWSSIALERRKEYQGVTCVCVDGDGKIIGGNLPAERIHCRSYELRYKMLYSGDMSGFIVTDVLKRFPFPEFPGEKFVGEAVVWLRIDRLYLTLFANIPVMKKIYRADGLTVAGALNSINNPQGARALHKEMMNLPLPLARRLRLAANYVRYSLHAGVGLIASLGSSGAPWLVMLAAPLGYGVYLRDKRNHVGEPIDA